MDKLDATDFWQMVSIVVALVLSFLPSIKPVKGFNRYSVGLVILFIIAVSTAVSTTITKSISDKENYANLVNGSESTLKRVNENLGKSNQLTEMSNESIQRLQDIQKRNFELQNEAMAINEKSSAIQNSSELLNKKLMEEIEIQKQTNKSANDILASLSLQKKSERLTNKTKLLSCVGELVACVGLLHDVFRKESVDTVFIKSTIDKEMFKFKKSHPFIENESIIIDSFMVKNFYEDLKNFESRFNFIRDSLFKRIAKLPMDEKVNIVYLIQDSIIVEAGVKNYLNTTIDLLVSQLYNPVLSESKSSNVWMEFYVNLSKKRREYLLDKTIIRTPLQLTILMDEHLKFFDKIYSDRELISTQL